MKTVLIVDECDVFRGLLHHTLQGVYRVLSATNAVEALDLVRTYTPDAIVLDIQLPGEMDGIQLCEIIKSDKALKDIFIILSTSDVDAALANLITRLHANDLILKPFRPDEILLKLNHLQ